MDYTAPDFDPNSLRVVDLRRILSQNNILWSSRHRKNDLVTIFNYELLPKLKKKSTKSSKKSLKKSTQLTSQNEIKTVIKTEISPQTPHETTPSPTTPIKIEPLPLVKQRKSSTRGKKRKISQLNDNNDTNNINSQPLKKKIKKKRNLSSNSKPKPKLKSKPKIQKDLFDRNAEIKFTFPEVPDSPIKLEEQQPIETTKPSTLNLPLITSTPSQKQQVSLPNNNNNTPSINTSDITFQPDESNGSVIIDRITSSTPVKIKLEDHQLLGPTTNIKVKDEERRISIKQELEDDVKDKLQQLSTLKHQIEDDLKKLRTVSNQIDNDDQLNLDLKTDESLQVLKKLPSNISSNNVTLDNDSAILTQLLNEFDDENSKIEIESEKVLNMINTREKFKYYRGQFIKLIIIWISILLFLFIFAIYRQERINVGFCGFEIRNKGSFINKWLNSKLKCIPCPDHTICYSNSEIACLPEYIKTSPIFWSIGGLLPTFNQCILDSTKVKKINKITRSVLDILSKRNASVKCGDGSDDEVGLNWQQIIEMVDQKLLIDTNDEIYDYLWNKVKIILTTRTDLKFITSGQDIIVRSISLSKLSIKCRIQRMIIAILTKYKFYLIGVTSILVILSWIFYQINLLQRKNASYRNIVKEVINKLQSQAADYKKTRMGKPYIAKIQLRDYYLPQLHKFSKNDRNAIWNKVVERIEKNSNINIEDIEVNGDIMRVWSWSSNI